jgi:hypothetical protein
MWDKTMDKYNRYSEAEKSGPLCFVIMMSKLDKATSLLGWGSQKGWHKSTECLET